MAQYEVTRSAVICYSSLETHPFLETHPSLETHPYLETHPSKWTRKHMTRIEAILLPTWDDTTVVRRNRRLAS